MAGGAGDSGASLKRHFGVSSLDGFGLHNKPDALRAAAAVLAYLQQMQPKALGLLTRLHTYTLGAFMLLDDATRRNLELTETMRGGDSQGSLLAVLDETRTPMGSRLLRRWINQPLLDVAAINRRLDAVQCCVDDTVLRLQVREQLGQIGDLERWTNRVLQGSGLPRDLSWDARRAAADSQPLSGCLTGPAALATCPPCPPAPKYAGAAGTALADDPPATLATPGIFRPRL
jgi:DNA mismatch repair protein MutS